MIRLLPCDCRDVISADISAILRYNAEMNDTRIKKGQRLSPATEFKPGQHWRPHGKHRERDWLEQQYVTLGRSTGDIAKDEGFTEEAIIFWMRKHGIPRRSIGQARALKRWGLAGQANGMFGRMGSANPNYVDGSSPERQRGYAQGVGSAFLRAVYERDGYRCVRCAEPKGKPRSLHAHHIVPWAGNEALRFDLANAVTLCRQCHSWVHSKANKERTYLA